MRTDMIWVNKCAVSTVRVSRTKHDEGYEEMELRNGERVC